MRDWLVAKRKAQGLTQREFALLLGIPVSTLAAYEQATRSPTVARAKVLAKKLDVAWEQFFDPNHQ
ncbi:helix-turn-helix transcriptional regulator [Lacticaseibacillus sp. N501-2]|uniref:helix-turn-helix transcriptional regulator n=1 Tax=Lacticaseibacillus salsurae TaxID=3367729 RepID=UPI0038B343EE